MVVDVSGVNLSVKLDTEVFNLLQRIAKNHFDGNKSKAINWLFRSIKEKDFLRFKAKHYAALMNHYITRREEIENAGGD